MSIETILDKVLMEIDPSRYTVYQMLDSIKDVLKIKPVQEKINNLYLFKTEPFIDSLYNFAHTLSEDIAGNDLKLIDNFFDGAAYRTKTPDNENINNLLLANGFKFKNTSYAMVAADLDNQDYDYVLPVNVKIICSGGSANSDSTDIAKNICEDIKSVFVDAYDYSELDYDRKFGFLNQFKLDNQDRHIKSFVLYENGEPVSTGSYYAYDKFSIENIGTIKMARGHGYATLILMALLQEAKKLGYNEACLVSSEAALAVYQKIGFEAIAKNNTSLK